jgi:hypothetical protein
VAASSAAERHAVGRELGPALAIDIHEMKRFDGQNIAALAETGFAETVSFWPRSAYLATEGPAVRRPYVVICQTVVNHSGSPSQFRYSNSGRSWP